MLIYALHAALVTLAANVFVLGVIDAITACDAFEFDDDFIGGVLIGHQLRVTAQVGADDRGQPGRLQDGEPPRSTSVTTVFLWEPPRRTGLPLTPNVCFVCLNYLATTAHRAEASSTH